MLKLKIFIHAAVMTTVNILSVYLAIEILKLFPDMGLLKLQIPAAFAISVFTFTVWYRISVRLFTEKLQLGKFREFVSVLLFSLLFQPIITVSISYIMTGTCPEFSHIADLWVFQLSANVIALGVDLINRFKRR